MAEQLGFFDLFEEETMNSSDIQKTKYAISFDEIKKDIVPSFCFHYACVYLLLIDKNGCPEYWYSQCDVALLKGNRVFDKGFISFHNSPAEAKAKFKEIFNSYEEYIKSWLDEPSKYLYTNRTMELVYYPTLFLNNNGTAYAPGWHSSVGSYFKDSEPPYFHDMTIKEKQLWYLDRIERLDSSVVRGFTRNPKYLCNSYYHDVDLLIDSIKYARNELNIDPSPAISKVLTDEELAKIQQEGIAYRYSIELQRKERIPSIESFKSIQTSSVYDDGYSYEEYDNDEDEFEAEDTFSSCNDDFSELDDELIMQIPIYNDEHEDVEYVYDDQIQQIFNLDLPSSAFDDGYGFEEYDIDDEMEF